MLKFTTAVARFKKSAKDWLTDDDLPALTALEHMAKELDKEVTPQMLGPFGIAYRNLLSRKPPKASEDDELEKALREADAQ